jgi:malate dehydrogenase (oxaloacetate-decarboxylating)(NADP+)
VTRSAVQVQHDPEAKEVNKDKGLYQEALDFHAKGKPGKIAIDLPKPLINQRDLALAYSPGVAAPCLEIAKDPSKAFDYTARGNFVAVISNGTAVLGLGNLGALASKPVMEGKAVLFKRFADIDAIDIEVNTQDPEEFINAIKYLAPSWGGINLEDIKAPECFIIEQRLKELMDIPVFHDDQHGTAIITAAGLINAAHLTGRNFEDIKVVVNGAGAAAIACVELIKSMGVKHDNVIMCDTSGVIYKGRTNGMNPWKEKHAIDTKARTLEEAMRGADVFLGLSAKGAVNQEMVKSMADQPIIFAMANPDPEITPEEVKEVRPDAIIATGRSDYNNQVNNVMGFPYIFRGALDTQATTINEEMKIAAAEAIAMIAREEVPEEVARAYAGQRLEYGPEYIIPVPFDPRLLQIVPLAVAEAAMKTGVARKPITNFSHYRRELTSRLNPTANLMGMFFDKLKSNPRRVIFAEGDEEPVIRAAHQWKTQGYGTPILVGYEEGIRATMKKMGIKDEDGIEITNSALNPNTQDYIEKLYAKMQRKGALHRDCARMIKRDRNVFSAMMLQSGEADAMVTGLTRSYQTCLYEVSKVIGKEEGKVLFGLSIMMTKSRTIFISDTMIHELPEPEVLVQIAIQTAAEARAMGHEPRVAFLSFSNFGNPMREKAHRIREAVALMDKMKVDFEYDGEMSADVALNAELLKMYPFTRLSQPANVLIMPALHTANIASKLLEEIGGGTVLGPILCGLSESVQILQMGDRVADILNMAAVAVKHHISHEND